MCICGLNCDRAPHFGGLGCAEEDADAGLVMSCDFGCRVQCDGVFVVHRDCVVGNARSCLTRNSDRAIRMNDFKRFRGTYEVSCMVRLSRFAACEFEVTTILSDGDYRAVICCGAVVPERRNFYAGRCQAADAAGVALGAAADFGPARTDEMDHVVRRSLETVNRAMGIDGEVAAGFR